MKKVALMFVLAVIAPSLVLAWLAVRSLRDQQFALERQQTLLYQSVADSLASKVALRMAALQVSFNDEIELLIQKKLPRDAADTIDATLRERWPWAEVGFAVSLDGKVLAPSLFAGPEARKFRLNNDGFLCSRESVEVYWNSPKGAVNLTKLDQAKDDKRSSEVEKLAVQPSGATNLPSKTHAESEVKSKLAPASKVRKQTGTMPDKDVFPDRLPSKVMAEEAEFQQIVGDQTSGTLARFLQNKLNLLFWYRSQRDRQLVFGAQLKLDRLVETLREAIQVEPAMRNEICVALLDDAGKPVALSAPEFTQLEQHWFADRQLGWQIDRRQRSGRNNIVENITTGDLARTPEVRVYFKPDWKHPFAATEIGEVLPHWEVAVYLFDPSKLTQSAATLKFTFGLIIGLLLLAIAVGSWLIISDLRRQLTLARQQTDFVSNVSHELKTPLTSIRMFSELLGEGRVEESKRHHYLSIITAEAARLTRLINNVLDFARMERGEKEYRLQKCDLTALTRETIEAYRPHLEANGFVLNLKLPPETIWINADRDALAQVLVNLVSNAEKYSGERKEIEVQVRAEAEWAVIEVLDRGLGVPSGCEEKIFEQFYRAHDSLSSGIPGSGLGLTLARQMAKAQGGDVIHKPRGGGGSCFILRLPSDRRAEC